MKPENMDLRTLAIGIAIGGIGDHLIGQLHWLVTGRALLWALDEHRGEIGDMVLDYLGDLFHGRGR